MEQRRKGGKGRGGKGKKGTGREDKSTGCLLSFSQVPTVDEHVYCQNALQNNDYCRIRGIGLLYQNAMVGTKSPADLGKTQPKAVCSSHLPQMMNSSCILIYLNGDNKSGYGYIRMAFHCQ